MASYGKAFADGWLVLVTLSVTGFFISIIGVVGQIVASCASMWTMFRLNLVWSVIFVFMSALLIKKYNEYGLAAAYFISYGIHFMITLVVYAMIKKKFDENLLPEGMKDGLPR